MYGAYDDFVDCYFGRPNDIGSSDKACEPVLATLELITRDRQVLGRNYPNSRGKRL